MKLVSESYQEFKQGGNPYDTLGIGIIKQLTDAIQINGPFKNVFINSKKGLIYFKNILNTLGTHQIIVYYIWDRPNDTIYEHRITNLISNYNDINQFTPGEAFGFIKYNVPNLQAKDFFNTLKIILNSASTTHWTQAEYDNLYPYLKEMDDNSTEY